MTTIVGIALVVAGVLIFAITVFLAAVQSSQEKGSTEQELKQKTQVLSNVEKGKCAASNNSYDDELREKYNFRE